MGLKIRWGVKSLCQFKSGLGHFFISSSKDSTLFFLAGIFMKII